MSWPLQYLNVANYTALRSMTSVAVPLVQIVDVSTFGYFYYDANDIASADNGGTIIVDAAGHRWKRQFNDAALAQWFGAKGDGTTDDTTALIVGAQAAIAQNVWLDLQGLTYAVTSWLMTMTSSQVLRVRNGSLIGLNPDNPTARTLLFQGDGTTTLYIRDLFVNRNGTGAANNQNNINNSSGIFLYQHAVADMMNVEVVGDNAGTGFYINTIEKVTGWNLRAHAIRYLYTSQNDDTVQGICINDCKRVDATCFAYDMGRTDLTSPLRDQFSRGVVIAGCQEVYVRAHVWRVDQGVDITGGAGSVDLNLQGSTAAYCMTNGFKVADTSQAMQIQGVVADQCGLDGVVIGGGIDGQTNAPRDIVISNNILRNIGTNGVYPVGVNTTAGVRLDRQTNTVPWSSTPSGVSIHNNRIYSDRGTGTFSVQSTDTLVFGASVDIPLPLGIRVRLTTTGVLPTPLATATDYWLIPTLDTEPAQFKLASSYINALDGVAITGISGGSGTQTLTYQTDLQYGIWGDSVVIDPLYPNYARDNYIDNYITGSTALNAVLSTPSGHANAGGPQSIPDTTYTTVIATNASYDPLGMFNTSTGIITIPFDGYWRVTPSIEFGASATGYRAAKYVVNGVDSVVGGDKRPNAGSSIETTIGAQFAGWLNKGDAVKLQVSQTSGGALPLNIYQISVSLAMDYQGGE
jgi:hypothetical protein